MADSYNSANYVTIDPGAYKGTFIGTAAGTTTIGSIPCFLSHIQVLTRGASGALTLYDSIGTSAKVLGTYNMGTQTFNDPPDALVFKFNTTTALTIVNSANISCYVAFLP